MNHELTSCDGSFLVHAFTIQRGVIVSPDLYDQVWLGGRPLALLKHAPRHAYRLWKYDGATEPIAATPPIETRAQDVQFGEMESTVTSWIQCTNGAYKIAVVLVDGDPRWLGLPVLDTDQCVLGMIRVSSFTHRPLITPMDVIHTSPGFAHISPILALQYRDNETAWVSSTITNVPFRCADIRAECGEETEVTLDTGAVVRVTETPAPLREPSKQATLLDFDSLLLIEDARGCGMAARRNRFPSPEQLEVDPDAWIVAVDGTETPSLRHVLTALRLRDGEEVTLVWSDGVRERVKGELQVFWEEALKPTIQQDPCMIE